MRDNVEEKTVLVNGRYRHYDSRYGNLIDSDLSHRAVVSYRAYSGTVTPGFRTLKKQALPFNPFSLTRSVHSQGQFVYFARDYRSDLALTRNTDYNRDTYRLLGSVSRSHVVEADYKAQEKAYESFSAIKMNTAQFFAERKQVVNMIGSTARRLVHAAVSLKKLRFADAYKALGISYDAAKRRKTEHRLYDYLYSKRLISRKGGRVTMRPYLNGNDHEAIDLEVRKRLEALPREFELPHHLLASYWLELQYGWKPLLQDVYAAAEVLGDKFRTEDFAQAVSVKASASEKSKVSIFPDITSLEHGKTIGEFHKKTTTKLTIMYAPNDSFASVMAQTGLSNPALLAWELLPFSFVADWFLPVGNYLENMHALDGYTLTSVNRTRFTKYRLDASGSAATSGNTSNNVWSEGWTAVYNETGVLYTRDVATSLLRIPLKFKNPVSITHAANAIALLVTVFRRT